MRTLPHLLLIIVLSLCCADAVLAHSADQPVREIYIRRDWAANVLPELIAQLQVPAIIELGRLEPIPEPPDEYTRKWNAPREIVPERAIETFAFREGTVGEALDAFCRENSNFEWREQDGVIILRRRSGHPAGYVSPLDLRADVRVALPMADAAWALDALQSSLNRVAEEEVLGGSRYRFHRHLRIPRRRCGVSVSLGVFRSRSICRIGQRGK